MKHIIFGIDESGYGPNLGPLVVAMTCWEAETNDITFLLEPMRRAGIHIGDSKKLYHGGSIAPLEAGLFAALRTVDNEAAPTANDETKIAPLAKTFTAILQQHRVRLLDMKYLTVEPEEFNQLLNRLDSKGTLLSDVTLRFITGQLNTIEHGNILILCDKHGGRNHYLDLLTQFFPDAFIQVIQQSRAVSLYRLTDGGRALEFRFLAKGETQLPIALASMYAKYHRELSMGRFNAFWRLHLPDIKPTSGYPVDASRFKSEISEVQRRLGIDDAVLWRNR